jgi:XTP/dITP diphosphohydrolase
MRLSNIVLLASTNRDKFDEFSNLLKAYPEIELAPATQYIRNAQKLSLVENYPSYLENAVAKARLANHAAHYPALADDSGLEVEALGGKPGVRSHRYAIPKAGISQDQANVDLLLSELKTAQTRSARFVCTLALVIEGILLHSTGILEGSIADSPRGTNGFGYDPVFIPKGQSKTLAEMTSAEKNAISHRSLALHDLMKQVKAHGLTFAKP